MRLIHKLLYSLLVVLPVVTLASCSSGGSGVPTGPAPEVSSIVVDAVPTADEAGLYIANQKGYFRQQGLSIKIDPILGGEPGMADLETGKAQIIVGNYVSFILAQISHNYHGKSIDLRIIADGSHMQQGNQAIYVMPHSRIKTVADLTKYHAKVGINTANNVGQVLFGSLFKQDGLSLSGIDQVYEGFPNMIGDLAKGKLDAAWLPEPFGTIAQETIGAMTLADFDQGALQNFPIGVEYAEALRTAALLLGRRSDEWFAARWASKPGEWADRLNSLPKYVVSSTLEEPRWTNVTVLKGNVVDEVTRLKHELDGDIVVYASYQLGRTLIEHDLVDELRLFVFPVVLGAGERLFGETSDKKPIRLVSSRTVGNGLAFLTYEIVRDA